MAGTTLLRPSADGLRRAGGCLIEHFVGLGLNWRGGDNTINNINWNI